MLAKMISAYAESLDTAVAAAVQAAAARVPGLGTRLAAAGITAVRTTADLARLPVLTKDDLLCAQRADPPFGGMLAPGAAVRRVFASPGPLYEVQPIGTDPWRWSPALRAVGIGPGDVVLNCFSYHLSPAGMMLDAAAEAVGATVIPAGVGNLELQAQVAAEVGANAYVGLPSYLKALVETSRSAHLPWPITKAMVTAEPLPDSLRTWLAEYVASLGHAYGTAEAGLLGYETAPRSGLAVPEGVLIEICDLDTGAPRRDDGVGQVVVTLLRHDQPLVRFGTGDLSSWTVGPDGSLRLTGVLGRVGEAVKVRGLFLHPQQASAALGTIAGLAGYRFVIDRASHVDTLRCDVVPGDGIDPEELTGAVRERIRAQLRLAADVACVPALPDGPAIVDQRSWS